MVSTSALAGCVGEGRGSVTPSLAWVAGWTDIPHMTIRDSRRSRCGGRADHLFGGACGTAG